ncbi:hypothetical protein QCA50_019193 [Cerrena zonata]|uniref:Uncharacterized protein n=1 Tax=Cerrena zonata TaxID=2478898 RepID=A0AAW0FKK3_9APHY
MPPLPRNYCLASTITAANGGYSTSFQSVLKTCLLSIKCLLTTPYARTSPGLFLISALFPLKALLTVNKDPQSNDLILGDGFDPAIRPFTISIVLYIISAFLFLAFQLVGFWRNDMPEIKISIYTINILLISAGGLQGVNTVFLWHTIATDLSSTRIVPSPIDLTKAVSDIMNGTIGVILILVLLIWSQVHLMGYECDCSSPGIMFLRFLHRPFPRRQYKGGPSLLPLQIPPVPMAKPAPAYTEFSRRTAAHSTESVYKTPDYAQRDDRDGNFHSIKL